MIDRWWSLSTDWNQEEQERGSRSSNNLSFDRTWWHQKIVNFHTIYLRPHNGRRTIVMKRSLWHENAPKQRLNIHKKTGLRIVTEWWRKRKISLSLSLSLSLVLMHTFKHTLKHTPTLFTPVPNFFYSTCNWFLQCKQRRKNVGAFHMLYFLSLRHNQWIQRYGVGLVLLLAFNDTTPHLHCADTLLIQMGWDAL